MYRRYRLLQGCCGADLRPRLRVALCWGVTKHQSAILVSLLAHAVVVAALMLTKHATIPPRQFQTIEISLVTEDPAIVALPSESSTPKSTAPHPSADFESLDAKHHRDAPNWLAPSNSALNEMPAMSK